MTNDQLTLKMPKLGLTMTEATLTRWLKHEGEPVRKDEILFEFESDKSLLEYECPADGVLEQIAVAEGETVPVGTPVAVLQVTGRRFQDIGDRAQEADSNQPANQPTSQPLTPPFGLAQDRHVSRVTPHASRLTPHLLATPAAKRRARELGINLTAVNGRGPQGRIHRADVEAAAGQSAAAGTPLAKRMARELGLDWRQLRGSGPAGRVVKADVLAAAPGNEPVRQAATYPASQPTTYPPIPPTNLPTYEAEPLSAIRRVIARRMSDSAFTAPHVTLFAEADATHLVEARAQLNSELDGAAKISFNALLTALVARALREQPHLNACLVDDEIRRYRDINIALAVDTARGLLTPVIRRADRLSLPDIQRAGDALIQRAVAGESRPDDLTGGTFTLTNLGMYDIDGFTPIINPPQAAILGVGRIAPRPVVVNNAVVVREMMILSLSFDHRLVDGGPAARFLQRVKQLIERPMALLLGP